MQRPRVAPAPVVALAALICVACIGGVTPALASGGASPRALLRAGERALHPAHPAAPVRRGADAEATLALRDLHAALPRLHGAQRRHALSLLARPTDEKDPFHNSYKVPEATPYCTANFCVHYVATTIDAPDLTDVGGVLGVPDYVEKIDIAAETSYAVENTSLGWPDPKSDGTLGGGDGLTDIYLVDIGGDGLFGYSAPDPPQKCARSCYAFLVMDNNFSTAEFGYPDPQIPLEVTIAHEYNHVLQFTLDTLMDSWQFESSATWSEEKVFPNDNDYVNYLPVFARTSQVPITEFGGGHGTRIYGLSVFNHFLDSGDGGLGPGVVLDAWKAGPTTKPPDFSFAAIDRSIRQLGGPGLSQEFTEFAAATAEWKTAGGFPDAATYPEIKRQGSLRSGAKPTNATLDHTAYLLFDVKPTNAAKLKLSVNAGKVHSGLALVGRDDDTATVTREVRYLGKGGKGSVTLANPAGFERITAVLINADGRISGYDRRLRDWHYTQDNAAYTVKLSG